MGRAALDKLSHRTASVVRRNMISIVLLALLSVEFFTTGLLTAGLTFVARTFDGSHRTSLWVLPRPTIVEPFHTIVNSAIAGRFVTAVEQDDGSGLIVVRNAGGFSRASVPRLEVAPQEGDVVLIGSEADGAWVLTLSTSCAASWEPPTSDRLLSGPAIPDGNAVVVPLLDERPEVDGRRPVAKSGLRLPVMAGAIPDQEGYLGDFCVNADGWITAYQPPSLNLGP